jgi:flagellar hook-length control protein FliK
MATYTAPSGPATAAPVLAPTGLTPAHAMIVAAPAQVVDIVSSAADDGQSDSIIVQLDPPELGRVSIDFKFDANGLQHVTITGESPEAMRQLRLMHFELIQALERHGIGSSNMTFQQQQQNTQQSPLPNPFAGEPVKGRPGTAEASVPVVPPYSLSSPRTLPGGRLDMKL